MAIAIKKGQRISQFTVKDLLPEGSGGMATVVRAVNANGDEVALKISHAANERYYGDALIAESEILQKLDHLGVIKILPIHSDIGKTRYMERATELSGNPWFFAMEFMEGGSLRDCLKKVNMLTPGEASFIAREVTKALEYVHSKSYQHNDVKTDNVLFRHKLEKGGVFEPVLIDFGIAAKTKHIQNDAGSLQWMSPERLQLVRKEVAPESVDANKVDIYAIGVLLYRMLTTKMPFTGVTENGVTSAIINKIPEHVTSTNSKVPAGLDELIIDCMAKRPEARPTTRQLIKELDQYSTDQIVTAPKDKGIFGKFFK
jgi:eukaryotic-like serine/threonine-protein kinase